MEKSYAHLKVPEGFHKLPTQKNTPAGLLRINALMEHSNDFKDTINTFGGWARTVRKQGQNLCFITLSDGSTNQNLQVSYNFKF
jgi:hypothetical protein